MSSRSDIAMLPMTVTAASGTATALDRYLGFTEGTAAAAYRLSDSMRRHGLAGIRLIDTEARDDQPTIAVTDALNHWHLLWARDEASASVTVASEHDEHRWSIAPGDTVGIPPGYRMTATGGQLALAITEVPGTMVEGAPDPPTHGTDHFAGYNRCTTIPVAGRLSLYRWKATQSLNLRQHHAGDLVIVTLAGEPAILTGSTVVAPRRGHAVFAPSGSEPRVLPNGLSYLLVIAPA